MTLPVPGISKYVTADRAKRYLESNSTVQPNGCVTVHGHGKQGDNIRLHQKGLGRAWLHVLAWYLHTGEPAKGDVSHRCELKACIRPDHLSDQSHSANVLDSRVKRFEAGHRYGRCQHERTRNDSGRLNTCAICNAEAQRRWRDRQKRGSFVDAPVVEHVDWTVTYADALRAAGWTCTPPHAVSP